MSGVSPVRVWVVNVLKMNKVCSHDLFWRGSISSETRLCDLFLLCWSAKQHSPTGTTWNHPDYNENKTPQTCKTDWRRDCGGGGTLVLVGPYISIPSYKRSLHSAGKVMQPILQTKRPYFVCKSAHLDQQKHASKFVWVSAGRCNTRRLEGNPKFTTSEDVSCSKFHVFWMIFCYFSVWRQPFVAQCEEGAGWARLRARQGCIDVVHLT